MFLYIQALWSGCSFKNGGYLALNRYVLRFSFESHICGPCCMIEGKVEDYFGRSGVF